jgi:hypothetical protein
MRVLTHRLAIASFIGVAALAVGVVPASAGPASDAAVGVAPASSAGSAVTTLPNVNIVIGKISKLPTYHPNAETVAPRAFTAPCTAAAAVLTITNKTAVSQTMLHNGKTFAIIPAKTVDDFCANGPAGAKATFGLTGSKSHLTVTLS